MGALPASGPVKPWLAGHDFSCIIRSLDTDNAGGRSEAMQVRKALTCLTQASHASPSFTRHVGLQHNTVPKQGLVTKVMQ